MVRSSKMEESSPWPQTSPREAPPSPTEQRHSTRPKPTGDDRAPTRSATRNLRELALGPPAEISLSHNGTPAGRASGVSDARASKTPKAHDDLGVATRPSRENGAKVDVRFEPERRQPAHSTHFGHDRGAHHGNSDPSGNLRADPTAQPGSSAAQFGSPTSQRASFTSQSSPAEFGSTQQQRPPPLRFKTTQSPTHIHAAPTQTFPTPNSPATIAPPTQSSPRALPASYANATLAIHSPTTRPLPVVSTSYGSNASASPYGAHQPPSASPSSLPTFLAPPLGALGSIMASPSRVPANGASASPLQPPRASGLLSSSDYHPPAPSRERTSGSFYDPLTDTTDTRRPSDSWSNKPSRSEAYFAPTANPDSSQYRNGYGQSSSPVHATFPGANHSPVSHSHPKSSNGYEANPASPTNRALNLGSPPSRHRPGPDQLPATRHTPTPGPSLPSLLNPEPATASSNSAAPPTAPASSTPNRAAELMSFSTILSNNEPVPKPRAPIMAEKKEKPARKSKGRESMLRDSDAGSTPKETRRSSSLNSREPAARSSTKRQSNGLPKQKSLSADKEKKIEKLLEKLEADADQVDFDTSEMEAEREFYTGRRKKQKLSMEQREERDNKQRRTELAVNMGNRFRSYAAAGRQRYIEVHEDEAQNEVREQEVRAEKERKKDMQRKRRREKSMQVTIEQREAALAKAIAEEDETERQKHLREVQRADKKIHNTKISLQRGIKGPARNLASLDLDGGSMSSFQASDVDSGKGKSKGRSGTRPKKSKEQKQAEKDSAEAAQAAIDAGEELPSREETKIRIKLSKSSKDPKDREGRDGREDQDKENSADLPPADPLETRFQSKGYNQIYDQIWRDLARKDVAKTFKLAVDSYTTKASNLKKTAILASKEAKRWQLRTNKGTKDLQARAKRCMRDMMSFWKRNEREERDLRKAAERQELENARKEEADREAARQKRKLNFLISQTELYSHFIGKKIKTDEVERSTDDPEVANTAAGSNQKKLDVDEPAGPVGAKVTNFEDLDFDAEDESALRAAAMANAQNAINEAQQKARAFNKPDDDMDDDGEMNFQNPTGLGEVQIEQPKLLNCQLKEYQLKGLNWLANLYEQGINGILADEMGLGKTVQSISVMAYLAEHHDIWGPFLVVAPASTLHNWNNELSKFVPDLKVLPYWGTANDRKVLRKIWDRKHSTYRRDAPFHVLVTSYQLVVSDVAYFQKMRWQYMILDEAQAIKSSQSSRWKCLLSFHCRNRLLLTGTPIQNNMQELWALLHFIMPSLFDSHDEFSEWFSKDIESHAQSNTTLNEDQLKRLHMILKPFMLRRVKKHVQKELGDKIELDVFCDLTYRQRAYYRNLRDKISIMDLIEKATLGDDQDSGTLMNLVMQFRKVCNHPDLFERADTTSPFFSGYFAETASFVREGNNVPVGYSTRSLIEFDLPRLVWEDGRLEKTSRRSGSAGFRNKYLGHMMNIWSPDNVRESSGGNDAFSFLRFADTSPGEAYQASQQDVFARATALSSQKKDRLGRFNVIYDEPEDENYTPAHAMFQIRDRKDKRALADITKDGALASLMNIPGSVWRNSGLSRLEQAARPGASAAPVDISLSGTRDALIDREETLFNVPMRKMLYGPTPVEEKALVTQNVAIERYPPLSLLPAPDNDKRKFTNIAVPSMRRFVTDSGKLAKLDQLLFKLKEEGHRVLLYFQMTRMIDLMEEYLTYRSYKFVRLDGSTKLEDRRDTVNDFMSRPEIFIFLLSTRAGGLGINLTAADTVIFYDSDWNPTIDSQAMDRAHRLGQTRQVTVYRLITRGTIEERIRKRAMQKEEVQRVVIQGGGGRGVDFSGRRPAENRNKDIALWLADDDQAELIERREKELLESGEMEKQTKKRGGGKRKREAVNLDDMYHEGEGHFDDANKASGTATPAEAAADAPPAKKKKGGGKKAKTTKQRLAVADGQI